MDDHAAEELLRAVKANKWTLGYIAVVTTVGLVIKVFEVLRG